MSGTWCSVPVRRPAASHRLYCLPHAGGGASMFVPLAARLPEPVELRAVLLPGRESRFRERPYDRMTALVTALADALAPELAPSYSLFGHSMGALVAFELARELRRRGLALPDALIASGRRAPDLVLDEPPLHLLPDQAFVAEIQARYGGIPQVILEEPELMELFLPTLKADFAMFETYRFVPEPPLPCRLAFYGGDQDPQSAPPMSDGWSRLVSGPTRRRIFSGGHFYLAEQRDAVADALGADLFAEALQHG
ncbi:thioesterase II family protein [Geminicoccus flavidas]|uniref:thioesterase II family protein n=1 Tax=Geminicoccus flavidas TaxID=2506407 RepID=UPI001359C92B|nr:alpha/beta fold hydrolase [Geminicoccus flavidas]